MKMEGRILTLNYKDYNLNNSAVMLECHYILLKNLRGLSYG